MGVFTAEQARVIRDNDPILSDRKPGVDLVAIIETRDAQIASGTAVVLSGTDNVVVAVGSDFDGKPAVATLAEADGAVAVKTAVWNGSGSLTITLSAVTTGDRTVAWIVDGR